jgi:hypothetical protein
MVDKMSKVPSITEQTAKVTSPTICQLRRSHPQPKDATAPEEQMKSHAKLQVIMS